MIGKLCFVQGGVGATSRSTVITEIVYNVCITCGTFSA